MSGLRTAYEESSFHPTDDGTVLYCAGILRWRKTVIIDSPERAEEILRQRLWWSRAGTLYFIAFAAAPLVMPESYLLFYLFLGFVYSLALVRWNGGVPDDLPDSPVQITFWQEWRKLVGLLSYLRILANLSIAVSFLILFVYLNPAEFSLAVEHWWQRTLAILSAIASLYCFALLATKIVCRVRERTVGG